MKPYYQDNFATIYNANCRDIFDELEFDTIITDPPYGVSMLRGDSKIKERIQGDTTIPDIRFMLGYKLILWGGNNFCDQCPRSTGWLVWYKYGHDKSHHSQAELAWTNVVRTVRHYSEQYTGFMRAREGHFHPTQKPVGLMSWCIGIADKWSPCKTIIDPFMGSGPVVIAAKNAGRKVIGIDIEEKYCEVVVKRLVQERMDFGQDEDTRAGQGECPGTACNSASPKAAQKVLELGL